MAMPHRMQRLGGGTPPLPEGGILGDRVDEGNAPWFAMVGRGDTAPTRSSVIAVGNWAQELLLHLVQTSAEIGAFGAVAA